jgi:hypothetical protein
VGRPPATSAQRAPASWPIQPTMEPPIGVDPSQASPHSAITRPRIVGFAASCSTVLAIELNVMLPYPTKTSAASSSGIVGASAASRIAMPQPIADRHSALVRGRPRPAATRPPATAPTPITEAITP